MAPFGKPLNNRFHIGWVGGGRIQPKYAALDFYVYGESYAGHYVPVVAKSVMDNLAGTINLRGAAIGNGLTNPMVQYQYYAPFAHEHGLVVS